MVDERHFVIVGASLAGAKAAEELRGAGFAGQVTLIGEERDRPYERPPLSKGYLLGKDARDVAYVHEPGWYRDHGVRLRLGVRATGLDPAAHALTLDTGERLAYDKLLLATGSRPRRLDVPGADLAGVQYLRTLPDADALLRAARGTPRVVVIGAGWIGLETAAAYRSHGAEVTVVESDRLPLRRVLGDEMAAVFADLHRANGVAFRFDAGVAEIRGADGRVGGVRLTDGTDLPADLVVVGVGIRPVVELAEAAGLAVDDGVLTDAALRTSDPDVHAAGDVARFHHPLLDRRIRVEHWANALNGGPAAARSMLGEAVSYDRVPYFFTDQYDLGMEYRGWVEPGGSDRVVVRGDPAVRDGRAPAFLAFWLRAGRVLAAMNVGVWDAGDALEALVRGGLTGATVDPGRLADPAVPLADLASAAP